MSWISKLPKKQTDFLWNLPSVPTERLSAQSIDGWRKTTSQKPGWGKTAKQSENFPSFRKETSAKIATRTLSFSESSKSACFRTSRHCSSGASTTRLSHSQIGCQIVRDVPMSLASSGSESWTEQRFASWVHSPTSMKDELFFCWKGVWYNLEHFKMTGVFPRCFISGFKANLSGPPEAPAGKHSLQVHSRRAPRTGWIPYYVERWPQILCANELQVLSTTCGAPENMPNPPTAQLLWFDLPSEHTARLCCVNNRIARFRSSSSYGKCARRIQQKQQHLYCTCLFL